MMNDASGVTVRLVTTAVEANEEVVDILEKVLHRAKNGELKSVAVVAVKWNGDVGTSYAMQRGGLWETVGALENLKYRLLRD